METVINLEFDCTNIRGLAGEEEGEQAFKEQVEPRLTEEAWEGNITIRFPEPIIIIGSSFWEGFAHPLVAKIGVKGVNERVTFVTSSERLTQELYQFLI
ncbi:hypothetical protein G6R29_05695 [Fructobacillus sp. M2-14]|uniref:DUF4325 domain-containing protein n=1 Tax=Fructobacillus broussonetiae TaxID=2713173 RepID=A0ABS5R1J5_9LACO|nr:hypothetical protein [Fructobacillus broussonetiae]MBS9339112.1 hypothetical protein [Fructobacillus broussonetiae]